MSAYQEKNAKQRGGSDFRADYELSNNPYSLNSKDYYDWIKGFLEAKEEYKNATE